MSDQVTQLYPILQAHFPWHKARVTFLSAFLLALMKVMTVNLTKRAHALNGKVKQKSNYRRIQRFFAEFPLPEDWATGLIRHLLPVQSDLILAMAPYPMVVGYGVDHCLKILKEAKFLPDS